MITKITIHINDRCLMVCLFVIKCFINMRSALTNIPNNLCVMCTMYLRPTTLILWTISLKVFLNDCPTLQLSSTITSMLLMWSISFSSRIELILKCHIFFLFCIRRPCSFWIPFTFTFIFSLPSMLRFILTH